MSALPSRDPFFAPTTAVRQGTTKQSPPTAVDAPSVEQLLKQAEACPLEPVRMLAGQIRAALEQLHTRLEEVAALTAVQRELLDAEARVQQLREKLATLAHADQLQPTGSTPTELPRPGARRRPTSSGAPPAASVPVNGTDIRYSHAVRDWARARGMQVASNGRIADTVIAAYIAAH